MTATHVLLGVIQEGRNVAVGALNNRGVPLDALARDLEALLPPPGTPRAAANVGAWTPADERLLAQAQDEARELRTEFFACEHVLLALLRDADGPPSRVLARHGVGYDDVRAEVARLYGRPDAGRPDAPAADGAAR